MIKLVAHFLTVLCSSGILEEVARNRLISNFLLYSFSIILYVMCVYVRLSLLILVEFLEGKNDHRQTGDEPQDGHDVHEGVGALCNLIHLLHQPAAIGVVHHAVHEADTIGHTAQNNDDIGIFQKRRNDPCPCAR